MIGNQTPWTKEDCLASDLHAIRQEEGSSDSLLSLRLYIIIINRANCILDSIQALSGSECAQSPHIHSKSVARTVLSYSLSLTASQVGVGSSRSGKERKAALHHGSKCRLRCVSWFSSHCTHLMPTVLSRTTPWTRRRIRSGAKDLEGHAWRQASTRFHKEGSSPSSLLSPQALNGVLQMNQLYTTLIQALTGSKCA